MVATIKYESDPDRNLLGEVWKVTADAFNGAYNIRMMMDESATLFSQQSSADDFAAGLKQHVRACGGKVEPF